LERSLPAAGPLLFTSRTRRRRAPGPEAAVSR